MRWRKRGRVFVPSGEKWWARTHAYLPTPVIRDNSIRVYFSGLDHAKVGRIGFVDLDPDDPTRVIAQSDEPALDVGAPGTFDDSGANPSCFITVDGLRYLLYIGWQRAQRVPYLLFCGIAVEQGEHFARTSNVPLLDRTNDEPFVRSATTVIRTSDGWRMWYVSAIDWTDVGGLVPRYVIRSAESTDGRAWRTRTGVTIDFESEDEYGFGRPWAMQDGRLTRLWYSIRSRTRPYRLGYAESTDGTNFFRCDHLAGLPASESGWDSEMICFGSVIDVEARRYLFYNGNGHGATGFGVAELESD